MLDFTISHEEENDILPPFCLKLNKSEVSAVYSDTEIQQLLLDHIQSYQNIFVFDETDVLYDRLTVEDNLKFFHKWYDCKTPLMEIIVIFQLTTCAKTPIKKCTPSEIRRVRYARYFMMDIERHVFFEPIYGVDVETINVFMKLLSTLTESGRSVLLIVSNMEHALLLADTAYRLHKNGLQPIEIVTEEVEEQAKMIDSPIVADIFKVPAKLDDKMILFDPTEIDYIESQDGKSMIVIEKESFIMDATLTEVEKKLEMYGFYRCHRSYIVNLQKVREIITWSKNTYSLRLNNKSKSTIPLSRTKVQKIQSIFNVK